MAMTIRCPRPELAALFTEWLAGHDSWIGVFECVSPHASPRRIALRYSDAQVDRLRVGVTHAPASHVPEGVVGVFVLIAQCHSVAYALALIQHESDAHEVVH